MHSNIYIIVLQTLKMKVVRHATCGIFLTEFLVKIMFCKGLLNKADTPISHAQSSTLSFD